jgi:hypothetical protein
MNTDIAPHSQLRALANNFEEARWRVRAVVRGLADGDWSLRPEPEEWSIAEQIVHLNLASRAYLPVIEEAIERGRASGTFAEGPYRRDFLGWMLARLIEPPVRLRVKTREEFVPVRIGTSVQALRTFEKWQDRFAAALHRAAGLALDRIEIASPYDPQLQMNLYSIDPPERRLSLGDGFRVEVRVVLQDLKNVPQIPTSAIFRDEQGWKVFAVENGKAVRRAVEVGHQNGLAAEIRSGLKEGDRVILHPSADVKEGSKVQGRRT